MDFAIRKQSFLEAPDYWCTRLTDIEALAPQLERAEHVVIGHSAGGRPIHCFAYGEREEVRGTATFSSAIASGNPKSFFDPAWRRKPVILIVEPVHGQEGEGVAGCLNLLSILERGSDLRGRAWPRIAQLATGFRTVVVPLMNPDGRERIPIDNLRGSDIDDVHYYGQGVTKEGQILTWPDVKQWNPIPREMVSLLGAYYNDAGVDLYHDDFILSPQPETTALLSLAGQELPDVALSLHACGHAPVFVGAQAILSPPYQARADHLEAVCLHRLRQEGYPIPAPYLAPERWFSQETALFIVSGCVSVLLELPHGMTLWPFTFDQIIDIWLLAVEELMAFGQGFGLRPQQVL